MFRRLCTAFAWPTAQAHAPSLVDLLQLSNSTEAFIERTGRHADFAPFWCATEDAITRAVESRVHGVEEVRVRLFGMDGTALGAAA